MPLGFIKYIYYDHRLRFQGSPWLIISFAYSGWYRKRYPL